MKDGGDCSVVGNVSNDSGEIVYVIDDDETMRGYTASLFASARLRVETFASLADFFGTDRVRGPSCLLLETWVRGRSGMTVLTQMMAEPLPMPIVFITAYGDIEMAVKAMKIGAFDFLTKPFRDQELLEIVFQALSVDRRRVEMEDAYASLQRQYEALKPREREVMSLVVGGLLNKQIAAELGLSEITVKTYRREVMRKTGSRTVADLVRKGISMGLGASRREVVPREEWVRREQAIWVSACRPIWRS
ncbi:response regulator transcription factor [Paraburkholderia jirisanensis]